MHRLLSLSMILWFPTKYLKTSWFIFGLSVVCLTYLTYTACELLIILGLIQACQTNSCSTFPLTTNPAALDVQLNWRIGQLDGKMHSFVLFSRKQELPRVASKSPIQTLQLCRQTQRENKKVQTKVWDVGLVSYIDWMRINAERGVQCMMENPRARPINYEDLRTFSEPISIIHLSAPWSFS